MANEAVVVVNSPGTCYNRDRGRRCKNWWAHQKGPPQGELKRVPAELWVAHGHTQGGRCPCGVDHEIRKS